MSIRMIVDNGNPRIGIIPRASAKAIVPVPGLPIFAITVTNMCYLLYYMERNYAVTLLLFCLSLVLLKKKTSWQISGKFSKLFSAGISCSLLSFGTFISQVSYVLPCCISLYCKLSLDYDQTSLKRGHKVCWVTV